MSLKMRARSAMPEAVCPPVSLSGTEVPRQAVPSAAISQPSMLPSPKSVRSRRTPNGCKVSFGLHGCTAAKANRAACPFTVPTLIRADAIRVSVRSLTNLEKSAWSIAARSTLVGPRAANAEEAAVDPIAAIPTKMMQLVLMTHIVIPRLDTEGRDQSRPHAKSPQRNLWHRSNVLELVFPAVTLPPRVEGEGVPRVLANGACHRRKRALPPPRPIGHEWVNSSACSWLPVTHAPPAAVSCARSNTFPADRGAVTQRVTQQRREVVGLAEKTPSSMRAL